MQQSRKLSGVTGGDGYDLGELAPGARVRVDLDGAEAEVFLMTADDLGRYRAGEAFQHLGGSYSASPVLLEVPHAGHWYVAVTGAPARVSLF